MLTYSPVVVGETEVLRQDTESLLCEYPGVIEARLENLSDRVAQLDQATSFGAEIEFLMEEDPSSDRTSAASDDELYTEILQEVHEGKPFHDNRWPKGKVLRPGDHPEPIM